MEFKIGRLYRVKNGEEKGNIIRIVNHDAFADKYTYETINEIKECLVNNFYNGSPFSKSLKPVSECIVIYRRGNKVIALNKVDDSKAVAKCHPDDDFDFMVGAKLAFQRLTGSEPAETDTDSFEENAKPMAKAFRASVGALIAEGFTRTEAIGIVLKMVATQ